MVGCRSRHGDHGPPPVQRLGNGRSLRAAAKTGITISAIFRQASGNVPALLALDLRKKAAHWRCLSASPKRTGDSPVGSGVRTSRAFAYDRTLSRQRRNFGARRPIVAMQALAHDIEWIPRQRGAEPEWRRPMGATLMSHHATAALATNVGCTRCVRHTPAKMVRTHHRTTSALICISVSLLKRGRYAPV